MKERFVFNDENKCKNKSITDNKELKTYYPNSLYDVVELLNGYDVKVNELENEVKLLVEFILVKGYKLEDFNDYLTKKRWVGVKDG